MTQEEVKLGEYSEIEYLQFRRGGAFRAIQALLGILTWPIVFPLAMLSRTSDIVFRSMSEFLSFIPYFPGVILRYEFYRFALKKLGRNVLIEFGVVFIHSDVEIGDDVLIGRYSILHHCNIGSQVLIGERCTFLSGMRQHHFDSTDIPMCRQGGAKKRIAIGDDCWIGSHSVVMESIENGCVIGAGSVVTKPISEYAIAVGSPATIIKSRVDHVRD